MTIGVFDEDASDVSYYLKSGTNLSYKKYGKIEELYAALDKNEVNYGHIFIKENCISYINVYNLDFCLVYKLYFELFDLLTIKMGGECNGNYLCSYS